MNGTIEETRNLLLEIREELLHSDVETSVIDKIDLAILELDDLEGIEDEKQVAAYCLQVFANVIRHLPSIQNLIDLFLS